MLKGTAYEVVLVVLNLKEVVCSSKYQLEPNILQTVQSRAINMWYNKDFFTSDIDTVPLRLQ